MAEKKVETKQAIAWREKKNVQGIPYYHNIETGELSAVKPRELKVGQELDASYGEWCWIPNDEDLWVPAMTLSRKGRMLDVKTEDDRTETVDEAKTRPLVHEDLNELADDLVLCGDIKEPIILYVLRRRLLSKQIYTNIGDILVSINPYQFLPALYSKDKIERYHKGEHDLPPHVFHMGQEALHALLYSEHPRNQSIIISGESGSGKTEATKRILDYLAEVAGADPSTNSQVSGSIHVRVVKASPVLEAFGNAKTRRNHNSSRFGKYIEVYFNKNKKISGAQNRDYLLEKSRVVKQTSDERNFHIFYQLCRGTTLEEKKDLSLQDITYYEYTKNSFIIPVPGIDDADEFRQVVQALSLLGVDTKEQQPIFSLAVAVLTTGNIQFERKNKDDPHSPVSINPSCNQDLKVVSKLLGVTEQAVSLALTKKMVLKIQADRTLEAADDTRNSLAKIVYQKLFTWIVERLNKALQGSTVLVKQSANVLGILDIFGFEIFPENSLEQLCINFTNEKLQQQFNEHTFELEEQVYKQEEVPYTPCNFINNGPVLLLIEGKKGILEILDDEGKVATGSDQKFLQTLLDAQKEHKQFKKSRTLTDADKVFGIVHYAGEVYYNIKDFRLKNNDEISQDLYNLVGSSTNPFVKEIFPVSEMDESSSSRKRSLTSRFREQLNNLMKSLRETNPRYVRCIKPNPTLSAFTFASAMVCEQLRYSGVFEATAIRRDGYPFRRTHKDFLHRYHVLDLKKKFTNVKEGILYFKNKMNQQDVMIGRTLVLYKAHSHRNMELYRNLALEETVTRLQTWYRMVHARKEYREIQHTIKTLKLCASQLNVNDEEDVPYLATQLREVTTTLKQANDLRAPFKMTLPKFLNALIAGKDTKKIIEQAQSVNSSLDRLLKSGLEAEAIYQEVRNNEEIALEIGVHTKLLQQAQAKIQKLKEKNETIRNLELGVEKAKEGMLQRALEAAERLQKEGVLKPDEQGLRKKLSDAKDTLAKIEAEKKVIEILQRAIDTGNWFRRGSVVETSNLDTVLRQANSQHMRTPKGKYLETLAEKLLGARQKLKLALDDVGDKDKWQNVYTMVRLPSSGSSEEGEEKGTAVETKRRRKVVDEYDEETEFDVNKIYETKEIKAIREEVLIRLEVFKASDLLLSGMAAYSVVEIKRGLKRVQELKGEDIELVTALNSTIKKADELLKAIETCVADAKNALSEADGHQKYEGGTTEQDEKNLKAILAKAREYGGMGTVPEIQEVEKLVTELEGEKKLAQEIKTALESGPWTNKSPDAKLGSYDKYQPKESVDTAKLDDTIKNVPPLKSKLGRTWKSFAEAIRVVRGSIKSQVRWPLLWSGLTDAFNHAEAKRLQLQTELGQDISVENDEFKAIQIQVDYHKEVGKMKDALKRAEKSRNETELIERIRQAETELNMSQVHHTELRKAHETLEYIGYLKEQMKETEELLKAEALSHIIGEAEKFGYQPDDEVKELKKVLTLVNKLEENSKIYRENELKRLLAETNTPEKKLNQNAAVILKALEALEAARVCREEAEQVVKEVDELGKGEGSLDLHFKRLFQCYEEAKRLGGNMLEIPATKHLKERYETVKEEGEWVSRINKATSRGGWLNHNVRHGDYQNYETPDKIIVQELAGVYKEGKSTITLAAKKTKALAIVLLHLRGKLQAAVGTQDQTAWGIIKQLLDGSKVQLKDQEHLNHRELLAAEAEFRYQEEVHKLNLELAKKAEENDEEELERLIEEAKNKNMMLDEKLNPGYKQGHDIYERIQKTKRSLQEALEKSDAESLSRALSEADSFKYETDDVKKCVKFLEVVNTLQEAYDSKKEQAIKEALNLALQNRLPATELTETAARVADTLHNITQLAHETKGIVDEVIERGTGVTQQHILSLQRVTELAAEEILGGMNDVEKVNEVRKLLIELEEEQKAITELKASTERGGWLNVGKVHGHYDSYQALESVDPHHLQQALERCPPAKTETGRVFLHLGGFLLELRNALVSGALKNLGDQQDEKAWEPVRKIIEKIYESGKELAEPGTAQKHLFVQHFAEFVTAKAELEYQDYVRDVNKKLQLATEAFDEVKLDIYLAEAKEHQMLPKFNRPVAAAEKRRSAISQISSELFRAMEEVDELLLRDAVRKAEFEGFDKKHKDPYPKCKALHDQVIQLRKDCEQAWETLLENKIQEALVLADQLRYSTDLIERKLRPLYEDAKSPDWKRRDKFLEAQLAVAERLKDEKRTFAIKVERRDLELKDGKEHLKYELSTAKCLLKPNDWAGQKTFAWDRRALASGMLQYTEDPIHHPLTDLNKIFEADRKENLVNKEFEKKQEERKALLVQLFNWILLFLASVPKKEGDKKKPETKEEIKLRPENLAKTILEICLTPDKPWIRNEAYCQLMKELTKNPGGDPRKNGWKLMSLFVRHFAPNDENMECVVETFLMKHGANEMRIQLQQLIFGPRVRTLEDDLTKSITDTRAPKMLGWERQLVYSTGITKLRYCL